MQWRLFWFRVRCYLAHWWQAKGIYRAHSPRIFQLYRQVLHNKALPKDLVEWRQSICKSREPLAFNEMGAGRDVSGARRVKTTVGALARRSGARAWGARVLYHLVRHYQPARVLEFGTNVGIASGYMASALPKDGQLTTVEGVPELATIATQHHAQLGIQQRIQQVNTTFDDYLDDLEAQARFDFLYIDGDHTRAATLNNIARLKPHLNPGAVLVVDDIYWSPQMAAAWAELCRDADFTVTADLFRIGLLYYRVQQAPQHFVLKV